MQPKNLTQLFKLKNANNKPIERLNTQQVNQYLDLLDNWQLFKQSFIQRDLECLNFAETTRQVNDIINLANELNHHPDVSFGYKNINIRLTTHSCLGLSILDFIFAAGLEIQIIN